MVVQTATATLTVNPAFLQEIKDSNHLLWACLHEVRRVCHSSEDRPRVARRLVRLLDELRDHLALQFALEESYGYLECPMATVGRLGERAEAARGEHCTLYLQLSELCETAEEFQYRGLAAANFEELVRKTLDFDLALREHERLETALIELAYYDHRRP